MTPNQPDEQAVTSERVSELEIPPGLDQTPGRMGGRICISGHRFTAAQMIAEISESDVADFADNYDFPIGKVRSALVGVSMLLAAIDEQTRKPHASLAQPHATPAVEVSDQEIEGATAEDLENLKKPSVPPRRIPMRETPAVSGEVVELQLDDMEAVLANDISSIDGGDYPEPSELAEQLIARDWVKREWVDKQTAALREQVARLEREVADLRAGYRALDDNWAIVHNAFSNAIRGALEMPDATVPELVERIRGLRAGEPGGKGP